jgi:transposase
MVLMDINSIGKFEIQPIGVSQEEIDSRDDLNEVTIYKLRSSENLSDHRNSGEDSHTEESRKYWFGDKVMECEHCFNKVSRIGYQKDHGDNCSLKNLDKESLLDDWNNHMNHTDICSKYGISEHALKKLSKNFLPNRVRPSDVLHTCLHCNTSATKSNIFRFHNDNCKLKDGKYEELRTDIMVHKFNKRQVREKYGLAGDTIYKFKKRFENERIDKINQVRRENALKASKQLIESGMWYEYTRKPMKCEHCNTTVGRSNYIQHHGDMCVFSVINIEDVRNDLINGMTLSEVSKKYKVGMFTIIKVKKGGYGDGKYSPINVDARNTKKVCPHCNTTTDNRSKGYHFDNCSLKGGKLDKIQQHLRKGYSAPKIGARFGVGKHIVYGVRDGVYGK